VLICSESKKKFARKTRFQITRNTKEHEGKSNQELTAKRPAHPGGGSIVGETLRDSEELARQIKFPERTLRAQRKTQRNQKLPQPSRAAIKNQNPPQRTLRTQRKTHRKPKTTTEVTKEHEGRDGIIREEGHTLQSCFSAFSCETTLSDSPGSSPFVA